MIDWLVIIAVYGILLGVLYSVVPLTHFIAIVVAFVIGTWIVYTILMMDDGFLVHLCQVMERLQVGEDAVCGAEALLAELEKKQGENK